MAGSDTFFLEHSSWRRVAFVLRSSRLIVRVGTRPACDTPGSSWLVRVQLGDVAQAGGSARRFRSESLSASFLAKELGNTTEFDGAGVRPLRRPTLLPIYGLRPAFRPARLCSRRCAPLRRRRRLSMASSASFLTALFASRGSRRPSPRRRRPCARPRGKMDRQQLFSPLGGQEPAVGSVRQRTALVVVGSPQAPRIKGRLLKLPIMAEQWLPSSSRLEHLRNRDLASTRRAPSRTSSRRSSRVRSTDVARAAAPKPHSIIDIPPVLLGAVLRPLTSDDDLLGEMLEGRA